MKLRLILLLLMPALVLAASCTTQPSGSTTTTTPPTSLPPFTCPVHGPNALVVAGDSLTAVWPSLLTLAPSTVIYNTAKGGANFTNPNTAQPQDSLNIRQRLLGQLDACDNDVGLVTVTGGINNFAIGQTPETVESAVASLSDELVARGVQVVWLPITPWVIYMPSSGLFPTSYDFRYDNRLTYNTWLRTPGNVTGDLLECNSTLVDQNNPIESMRPAWYSWLGWEQPDRYHPNLDGYKAFAGCLSSLISSRLPI